MSIDRIINNPVPSNTYIISNELNHKCLIVDPGSSDSSGLFYHLECNELSPEYIILTHEHFDHIWGVNAIKERYNCKVIASSVCASKISIPQNYFVLLYLNDDTPYFVETVDILVEDINFKLRWDDCDLNFYKTPGHSDSSICFSIDNNLFTGDTIIKNHKPVVKKRHNGSYSELFNSLRFIFENFNLNATIVYPGHEDSFVLREVKNQYIDMLK